jgi:hypothetical protein
MLRINTGSPDPESAFEVLIRVAIGAGESSQIRSALAWGVPERRLEDSSENSAIDRYWDKANAGTERHGHSVDYLLKTKEALQESLFDSPSGSRRQRDVEEGIAIVDVALAIAQCALSNLAASAVMKDLTAD